MGLLLKTLGAVQAPVVTSFRGSDATSHFARHPRIYDLLKTRGDLFLPVSSHLRDALVGRGFPPERCHVLYSGLDCAAIPYSEPDTRTSPFQLLAVGRLVEKKGFRYAVRAVAELRREGRDVRLLVAGDGPLRSALVEEAARAADPDAVTFLSWIPQERVLEVLRRSDVLVAPSVTAASGDQEGIPNVLKEAMASGVPVVATDHGGIPDLVKDGATGLLVPEKDPSSLAAAIRRLHDQPALRVSLARAARAAVEREFDSSRLAERLEKLYALAARHA